MHAHAPRVSGHPVRRARTLLTSAGVVVLFAVILVATSLQGRPEINPPQLSPGEPPPPPLPEAETSTEPPLPTEPPNAAVQDILGAVLLVVMGIAAALVLYGLVRLLRRLWQDRPLRRQPTDAPETSRAGIAEPEEAVAAPVVRRGVAGALRTIEHHPVPSDAIVAAWVGLEETAADAGLRRGVSETPGEFALRLMSMQSAAAAPATRLLELYERVRFGGLEAGETERALARAALQEIEEEWR